MRLFALGLLAAAGCLLAWRMRCAPCTPAWGYVAASPRPRWSARSPTGSRSSRCSGTRWACRSGTPPSSPTARDAIGCNLGAFVENHFITEEAISSRIRQADPAARIGAWLIDPANAATLGRSAATAARHLLESLDHEQIRDAVRAAASRRLEELDLSGTAGQLVDRLMQDGRHQALLDALLDGAGGYLATPTSCRRSPSS